MNYPLRCLGRHYTPSTIASGIIDALGVTSDATWLEPSFGSGAFLRELAKGGVEPEKITGVELESLNPTLGSGFNLVHGSDFLAWARKTEMRFDRIVGNPPFVSLSQLTCELRNSALEIRDLEGAKIPKTSNTWYAFLLASLSLLARGGRMGFVLPAAWSYADYASGLRSTISRYFRKIEVHRCDEPVFNDALDGRIVLLCFDYGYGPGKTAFEEHDTVADLLAGLKTGLLISKEPALDVPNLPESIPLSDLLDIRIGAVTGDASYFLFNEELRARKELPKECLIPVVSKSRHISRPEIGKNEWDKLRKNNERVWLFRPTSQSLSYPEVQKYLQEGQDGLCNLNAYKVRIRKNWYETPLLSVPDGFFTGMSNRLSWPCLNRMRGLCASNTLYTFNFKHRMSINEKFAWLLAILGAHQQTSSRSRKYADGLLKWEPSDLHGLRIQPPKTTDGARKQYFEATRAMLEEDYETVDRLVAEFL